MSKLLKLPFALLVALAMLVLWSGAASAEGEGLGEEVVPSGTSCDVLSVLPECQSEREPAPVQPAHPANEPLETGEAIPAFTGPQALLEQQSTSSESVESSGTETEGQQTDEQESGGQQPAPSSDSPPDPAVVGECIAAELEGLLAGLEEALGDAADGFAEDIQGALTDPTTLPAFLAGLQTRLETELPEFAAQLEEDLPAALEGIAACLPAPPAPPAEEQPPAPKPAAQPAQQPAVHYANCDDARAKGAAPVYSGQPGYGSHLDSDNDGVGCEQETAMVSHTPTAAPQLAYTGFEAEPFLVAGAALLALGTLTVIGAARRES